MLKIAVVWSWRARPVAAERPAGPAPIIRASKRGIDSMIVQYYLSESVGWTDESKIPMYRQVSLLECV